MAREARGMPPIEAEGPVELARGVSRQHVRSTNDLDGVAVGTDPARHLAAWPSSGRGGITMKRLVRIFLTGLLAALPLLLTIFVSAWLLSFVNQYFGPSSAFGET